MHQRLVRVQKNPRVRVERRFGRGLARHRVRVVVQGRREGLQDGGLVYAGTDGFESLGKLERTDLLVVHVVGAQILRGWVKTRV